MKSVTDLLYELFGFSVRGIPCEIPSTTATQKRATLKVFLLESSVWAVFTLKNVGASVHNDSSQSIIAIRNVMNVGKIWKVFCRLFRAMNGNQIMKHQINSVNYSITQRELYEGRYPKSMKILMSTMPHHTFGKLFQLRTGHGGRGKCSQMNCVRERNGYCEYFQLETIGHVLKECPLNPAEQDMLKKVSLKLDHIKSAGFTTVTSLLIDRYIRAACWGFTECQSLVSTYWVLCIAGSLEHMELFMKNSVW